MATSSPSVVGRFGTLVALGAGCFLAPPATGQPAAPETLGSALASAYEDNPAILSHRASARAVDEEYVQARSGLRPSADFTASVARGTNQGAVFLPSSPLTNTSEELLQLNQPIYTGGRVAHAENAARADAAAAHQTVRSGEMQLLQSVAAAYLDVRRGEEQLTILRDAGAALQGQLDETNARFAVGEATRTDVAEAQTRVAQAAAQTEEAEGSLSQARSRFSTLVGHYPGTLAPPPDISNLLPPNIGEALQIADRDSPVIKQAVATAEASSEKVGEAKAAFRPSLSVSASLGYVGGEQPLLRATNNPFANGQPDITVAATATVPIFSGGLRFSQVRQAAERSNADRYSADNAKREVEQSVSLAWSQHAVAHASTASYQAQVDAASAAFEGARKEEQAGLRTTIDVLNAEQEMQDARIALTNAQHDDYLASIALLAATGQLSIDKFDASAPVYDPSVNFRARQHSIGWVPWEGAIDALDHIGDGQSH